MLFEHAFEAADRAIVVEDIKVPKSVTNYRIQIEGIGVLRLVARCCSAISSQAADRQQKTETAQDQLMGSRPDTAGQFHNWDQLTAAVQSVLPWFGGRLLICVLISAHLPAGKLPRTIEAMLTDVATEWNHADRSEEDVQYSPVRPSHIDFMAFRALNSHGRSLLRSSGVSSKNRKAAEPLKLCNMQRP